MIPIKDIEQLAAMREAGRVAATVLAEVAAKVKPGMTTRDLDEYAATCIRAHGASRVLPSTLKPHAGAPMPSPPTSLHAWSPACASAASHAR